MKASATLPTRYGSFRISVFEAEDGTAYSVLSTPDVTDNALVRVHSECETGDVFGSLRCDCGEQLHQALEKIAVSGNGLLIYMRKHEGRGIGITNKIRAYALQDAGADTVEANHQLGFESDLRSYDMAASILNYFGVYRIRLLSNNPAKLSALAELGITVTERVPIMVEANPHNARYLATKRSKMGHF